MSLNFTRDESLAFAKLAITFNRGTNYSLQDALNALPEKPRRALEKLPEEEFLKKAKLHALLGFLRVYPYGPGFYELSLKDFPERGIAKFLYPTEEELIVAGSKLLRRILKTCKDDTGQIPLNDVNYTLGRLKLPIFHVLKSLLNVKEKTLLQPPSTHSDYKLQVIIPIIRATRIYHEGKNTLSMEDFKKIAMTDCFSSKNWSKIREIIRAEFGSFDLAVQAAYRYYREGTYGKNS